MPQSSPNPTPRPKQSDLFGMEAAVPEAPPKGTRIARVQLEGAAAMELDYAIPEHLADGVVVGSRVMVPLQNRRMNAVVLELLDKSPHRGRLKEIASIIAQRPMFTPGLLKLARWIAEYYVVPVHTVLRTMLPQAVRDKPGSFVMDSHLKLLREPPPEVLEKLRHKAPMQARLIDLLRSCQGEATLSQLRRDVPRAASILKPLLKAGWITRSEVRVERDPFHDEEFLPSQALTFTDEQQAAYTRIAAAIDSAEPSKPILLHGITGSGKTEVYLQAIARVLERGGTALVLVPEIALTPQTIERFKARFSDRSERIAVLHSHLSDGERHDEWFKIHEDRADIVIGARSAIFAPLERLGIIIVDEEHEP
ncbi:MAG TPA: DEAD/DEAH box helicase family protein, partial [Prosthecobacter sp.]|nr:DEAD/DEAH box helicase family protein [Prosthecobacter sp.]